MAAHLPTALQHLASQQLALLVAGLFAELPSSSVLTTQMVGALYISQALRLRECECRMLVIALHQARPSQFKNCLSA
eukprot:1151350-Pelagomonas_calceolata.AAC.3